MNADPRKQHYEEAKLVKRLRYQVGQAIADCNMIEDGDKVLVTLSAGKDSHTMLDTLLAPLIPYQLSGAYRKYLPHLGQGRTIAVG